MTQPPYPSKPNIESGSLDTCLMLIELIVCSFHSGTLKCSLSSHLAFLRKLAVCVIMLSLSHEPLKSEDMHERRHVIGIYRSEWLAINRNTRRAHI